jgi:hypothetical protein
MNSTKTVSPASNEIEVTLLGPGYGESIIIHIGNNQWIVIDSCIDIDKDSCAPLDYLKIIGVDPSNVVLIVASHWHDDHVKGLSTLVEACHNAKFSCSIALANDEFRAYVTRYEEDCQIKWGSGVSELFKILEILRQRRSPPYPIHATSNKIILDKTPGELGHSSSCEVWTLSPSDGEISKFLYEIKNVTPIEGEPISRAYPTRNNISVVVQIIIGDEVLLLGSDLEETQDPYTGWSVIVSSNKKRTSKAKIFKIPHHGSITGHSEDVWTHLIQKESYAILTPYNRGKKLPSPPDIERIQKYTPNSYCTVPHTATKTKKRSSIVEKSIAETVGKIRQIPTKVGMIRLRKKINSDNSIVSEWDIKLFDGACHLSTMT